MPRHYKKLGEEEKPKKPGILSRVKKALTPTRKPPTTRVAFEPGGGIKETTSGRKAPTPKKQAIQAGKTMKELGAVATEIRREFPDVGLTATVARKVMAELPASVSYLRRLPEGERAEYVKDVKSFVREKTQEGQAFTPQEAHKVGQSAVRVFRKMSGKPAGGGSK